MKKKLTVLLLVLTCLAILAGCGCEHEWEEADCVNPRHCTLCEETEGEPLGHVWMAATCEAPKTCEVCSATDGDPINTDPRFTTAATKDIQGKWSCMMQLTGEMMGLEDFPGTLDCNLILDFSNDGKLGFAFEIANEEAFMESMVAYTMDVMYKEFASAGIDQATADAAMVETYGMTTEQYVRQQLEAMDFDALFDTIFAELGIGGAYYVEGTKLYVGGSWNSEMVPSEFTLEGDTLSIPDLDEEMGVEMTMTRVTEE